ncbi:MAG: cyclodeaminase/cyclohydrolase family protein [Candidatus Omnitrophica bacterium]|nr:cyclodeaminase/cyclohydrolase family protein [Candidatus Omnitrophota bacterium]
MKDFKNHTLKEYLDRLSAREPVPGGGSAAALSSALGAGLIAMVIEYSMGKGKPKAVEKKFAQLLKKVSSIRQELLDLVDQDAKAYLGVVAARKLDIKAQKKASLYASRVPRQICQLSYMAVDLTPYVVQEGNPHLLSDVEVALELLLAGYHSALVMIKVNQ